MIYLLSDGLLFWIVWQVFSRFSGWISSVLTPWIGTGNLLGWIVAFFVKIADTQVESLSRKVLVSWLSVLIRISPEGSFLTALTYLL